MNILFLDQYGEMGGAQHCLLDLIPAIEERGWQARAAIPSSGPLANKLRARGVRVEEIRCGPYTPGTKVAADMFRFVSDVPKQASAISRLLDQTSADLLYVNGPRLLPAAMLAACGRVLFHAHHSVGQRVAAWLEGIALRRTNATVAACCESVAQSIERWIPRDRIHVVPNGTADLGFNKRNFNGARELRIGIVGRIAPDKGQTEFLRAAALLTPVVRGVRFVICGAPLWGDREYFNEVQRLAMHLPVEFLEWRDGIGAVLAELDLLVLASSQEGMPRVMLEAFSAGVPVVAFRAGGVPEVIEDGVNGFLTCGSTAYDLADRLRELIEGGLERLSVVAQNARNSWERHHTLAAYQDRVMEVIEKCVPDAARETAVPLPHK